MYPAPQTPNAFGRHQYGGYSTATPPQPYTTTPQSAYYQAQQPAPSPATPATGNDANSPQQQEGIKYQKGFLYASTRGRHKTTPSPATHQAKPQDQSSPREINPFEEPEGLFSGSKSFNQSFNQGSPFARGSPRAGPSKSTLGNTSTVDEDAPPTVSMYDADPLEPDRPTFVARPSSTKPAPPPAEAAPAADAPVKLIIFGYPEKKVDAVRKHFMSLGDVVSLEEGPPGSNWMVLGYRKWWDAQRIARRNGEVMEGIYRIGVAYEDPSQADAPSYAAGSSPPIPSGNGNGSTNAIAGSSNGVPAAAPPLRSAASHISLAPSSSAFKPVRAPVRASFGGFSAINSIAAKSDAQVAVEAAQKAAAASTSTAVVPTTAAQPKTIAGRLSDLVFGW